MLMTVNPSECNDPAVLLACSLGSDSCPAACQKDADETTVDENGNVVVVKSGDLSVTANAAAGRKVIVSTANNTVSDLDTLTFKTSEEVELNKVVLERYGYSSNSDIANIWLEDEAGNVITNKATLNTKGQANLTVKKDYRKIDGSYNATIVVEVIAGAAAGKTIGFKVVDVESSAKNVDLANYTPYTYDTVVYSGVEVSFTVRWTTKDYNLEAGSAYEVAKFKAKAPADSAILVKGFTLTNIAWTRVDLNNNGLYTDANEYDYSALKSLDVKKYLDKIIVNVGGKEVKASANINKDDELVVSFDENVEIPAKENVEFTVEATFTSDFDAYGSSIIYGIVEWSHFNAVDVKNEARVSMPSDAEIAGYSWPTYTINGGKVKLTNTKLGNVDAALDSTDVVIAEGNINVTETIKWDITVTVNNTDADYLAAITAMRLQVAGDEYDGKEATAGNGTWTFKNVEIEKAGKVRILVDITDKTQLNSKNVEWQSFTFTIAWWDQFHYTEGKVNDKVDIAGSISPSKLTIQAAKASLTNSLTKAVEYKNNESNRKVVFDWVYTAKKGDVKLNEFKLTANSSSIATALSQTATDAALWHNNKVTFYVFIDGDEVADAKLALDTASSKYIASTTFSDTLIEAGKTAKIVIEAEIDAKNTDATDGTPAFSSLSLGTYKLELQGEDNNGNTAWYADKNTVELKIVETWTASVDSAYNKSTVLKKENDAKLAEFVVKPANGASELDLDSIKFNLYVNDTLVDTPSNREVTLSIDDTNEDRVNPSGTITTSNQWYVFQPVKTIDSKWVVIKVTLDDEFAGVVELKDLAINGKAFTSRTFKKSFEDAIVQISSIRDMKWSTELKFKVDKESDATVKNVIITFDKDIDWTVADTSKTFFINWIDDGDTAVEDWAKDATRNIKEISYEVTVTDTTDMPSYCTDGTSASCKKGSVSMKCSTESATCYKVVIDKANYDDFFKLSDGTYARIIKSNTD